MPRHRNPRKRLSKPSKPSNPKPEPTFDYDGVLEVLRDNIGRADAMVAAADELIVKLWGDGSDGDHLAITRRRNHVSYYLESARLAVREAMHAGDDLDLHRGRA